MWFVDLRVSVSTSAAAIRNLPSPENPRLSATRLERVRLIDVGARKIRRTALKAVNFLINGERKMYLWKMSKMRAAILAVTLAASAGAGAHPGDLDTRFGAGGSIDSALADLSPSGAMPIAVDHDNRIIYGAMTLSGGLLGALNSTGDIDASFGGAGYVSLASELVDVRIDSHNRIVALSSDYNDAGYVSFEVLRFNSDGTPDTSFGTGGVSIFGIDDYLEPAALALDAHDDVFVAGTEPFAASGDSLILVGKLDSKGAPDAAFGSGGIQTLTLLPPGTEQSTGAAIAVDAGGIYVSGFTYAVPFRADIVLAKLKADGSFDPLFGPGGFVVKDAIPTLPATRYSFAKSMVVDDKGSIVLAGGAGDGMGSSFSIALRYLPDGTLDPSFNRGEPLAIGSDAYQQGVTESLFVDARGKLVVTNYVQQTPMSNLTCAVYRLEQDGTLDLGFKPATDCGAGMGWRGALTQSGDILVFGARTDGSALTWTSFTGYDIPGLPHHTHP